MDPSLAASVDQSLPQPERSLVRREPREIDEPMSELIDLSDAPEGSAISTDMGREQTTWFQNYFSEHFCGYFPVNLTAHHNDSWVVCRVSRDHPARLLFFAFFLLFL